MSTFSGPQGRGAMTAHRKAKREQAEARNAVTPPERRRAYRTNPGVKLLTEVFGEQESE